MSNSRLWRRQMESNVFNLNRLHLHSIFIEAGTLYLLTVTKYILISCALIILDTVQNENIRKKKYQIVLTKI